MTHAESTIIEIERVLENSCDWVDWDSFNAPGWGDLSGMVSYVSDIGRRLMTTGCNCEQPDKEDDNGNEDHELRCMKGQRDAALDQLAWLSDELRSRGQFMKIEVTEDETIALSEFFSGLILRTTEGNEIGICLRDDTFEFSVRGVWFRINMQDKTVDRMGALRAEEPAGV